MNNTKKIKYKYTYCNILSIFTSLLALMLPILTSLAVDRVMYRFNLRSILPILCLLFAVQSARTALRFTIAKYVGDNPRAPLFWLQRRLGGWLWWVEPFVHNWGAIGMLLGKFGGKKGLPAQIAIGVSYFLSDFLTSVLSGVIYYFTQSYILSLLSSLVLPMFAISPWFSRGCRRQAAGRKRRYRV